MTQQTKFDLILPTTDNAVPPNLLTTGQMTQLDFVVNSATYVWPIPATTAPGAVITVLFASTTPPFVPVAGNSYTGDVFAVDVNGNGAPSGSITWTETAAPTPPAAPTGFTVS
jgi:hypothetical protein